MDNDQKKTGSYYIMVKQGTWYVYYQHYVEGKRKQEIVPKLAQKDLGFRPEMSVDDAKGRCKHLNSERCLLKEKIRLSAKRVTGLRSLDGTLFPPKMIEEFDRLLDEENFGSTVHLQKIRSHFEFVQTMCKALRILPIEYKPNAKKIYKYFIKRQISINYCSRIVSLLNRWGQFYCKTSGVYFDAVPVPRGIERSAIVEAQASKQGNGDTDLGVRVESLPLTPEDLQRAKDKFKVEQFNWLALSIWFGLRPNEVDGLKKQKNYRLEFNKKKNIRVLSVYQSKLKSVSEPKRWKKIPILFTEQVECLDLIVSGAFARPLNKTVRKYVGRGITLYGGRKNFVDLMLAKGQSLDNISNWLGHKDISTTWRHYKDKTEINYTETDEVSKTKLPPTG